MSIQKFKGKIPKPNYYTIQGQIVLKIQNFDKSLIKETTIKDKYTYHRLKDDTGTQNLKFDAKVYWGHDSRVGNMYTEEWVDGQDNLNSRMIIIHDNKIYLCGPD